MFSGEQLGLPEDFCTPLPAAVVELAGLDMRTTPLDRMTCIYDTVEQVSLFRLLWVCQALVGPFFQHAFKVTEGYR